MSTADHAGAAMSIVNNWTKQPQLLIWPELNREGRDHMDQEISTIKPGPTKRRRGERTRTIPEQIADDISHAIVNGDYRGGERIREQELATLYGVSRGPVREAIRTLQERGLVNFFPRRGAYIVDITLDTIVEVFNVRAALMGLAARDLARRKDVKFLADLREGITEARILAKARTTPPQHFARAIARLGGMVAARCGNKHLSRLLRDQLDHTLWGIIWRDRPLDFFTAKRQSAAVREWEAIAIAIEAREDKTSELLLRRVFFNARNAAIETLQKARNELIDKAGIIKD